MEANETLTIRAATVDDCARLAVFARRTFSDAFAARNTPEDMRRYLGEAFNDARMHAELDDPTRLTLLGEMNGTLAAYAQLSHSEVEPCVRERDAIELVRFYVDRSWQGRGVAQRMMQAVDAAAARRARAIWLGVWEKNARAIAFYQKCGFEDVGSHPFMLGTSLQTDRIMARTLALL